MLFYRFTDEARRVLSRANVAAHSRSQKKTGAEHILQGLVEEESGKAFEALRSLNISRENVVPAIDTLAQAAGTGKSPRKRMLSQSRGARQVVANAIAESRKSKRKVVGTEHLLLGLLNIPDSSAVEVLESMGFSTDGVRQAVLNLMTSDDC